MLVTEFDFNAGGEKKIGNARAAGNQHLPPARTPRFLQSTDEFWAETAQSVGTFCICHLIFSAVSTEVHWTLPIARN